MEVSIRQYRQGDIGDMVRIWNEVVEEGVAFPQEELLDENSGKAFFDSQTYCGVAEAADGRIYGLYILHPNNIGRCGHICNASYAVSSEFRGLHIGEKLVMDCLEQGRKMDSGSCSSTQWWLRMCTPAIYTNGLASGSWAQFPRASG